MTIMPLATARGEIADFLQTLVTVYVILIIGHILVSLLLSAGMRLPDNRVVDAIVRFLREAVEPFLLIFRRVIPPLGPLDLSPIVAILLLQIGGGLVVDLVRG
ncbi:MAG: YggT family protein [Solirubrobacteraceae bacterium]|nr:YggT family protein [Solirubrobacteraceae bacterium]